MDSSIQEVNAKIREASASLKDLNREIGKVIVGQQYLVDRLLMALLADGHILIEGVPGAANASNNGGSSWYVFDSSPNKAAAVDFLKSVWASSDPASLAFYNDILKG